MSRTPAPVFFGPTDRPCFGWLHASDGGKRESGVLICKPFGYEGICAHRSVRHLAERSAAVGVPALRFDHDGCGDSAGSDADPERVAAWVRSVHAAADELKRRTGVTRIYLLGLRLGATLAALAALERSDIAGFIAIAPVIAAKSYLRELRVLQMALNLTEAPASYRGLEGEREAAGFLLTAETQAALTAVDLAKLSTRVAERVLLLDRDDLPVGENFANAQRAAGANVEHQRVQGFTELVLDPHHARVPESIVQACLDFMADAPLSSTNSSKFDANDATSVEMTAFDQRIRETAVFFNEQSLFGVVSEPAAEATSARKAVLLLNSGAIHHIGPNRNYVTLARLWASRGYVVARADLSGIGDSPPRNGEAENVVYSPHAQADIRAMVEHLRRRPGVSKVYVAGVCSGAYNAFKAAVAGLDVAGVIPINPLVFFWKEGMSLDLPQQHEVVQDAQRYSRMMRRTDAWKRLISGKVDMKRIGEVLVQQSSNLLEGYARSVGRYVGRPFPDDLGVELESVTKRGVRLVFVFSAADPGVELLRMQGGRTVQKLSQSGKLERYFIAGANHTFTALWMQEQIISKLSTVLDALPA